MIVVVQEERWFCFMKFGVHLAISTNGIYNMFHSTVYGTSFTHSSDVLHTFFFLKNLDLMIVHLDLDIHLVR